MNPLVELSESDLVDRALGGDSAAFGELVCRHQDRLHNGLLHLCGSPDDALDIAQEAFVKAYLKLGTFRRNSAFYTWLYRIAFNLLMTERRGRRRPLSLDERQSTGNDPVDCETNPMTELLRQDRVQSVKSAMADLGEDHRHVLVLREIEGCDYETIAELLDVPLGTVRSRLHRARLELRERLREVVEEDAC